MIATEVGMATAFIPAEMIEEPVAPAEQLARGVLATYALPSAVVGFAFFMINIFFLKFATDVLGVAAGAMGGIFLVSRIWDAVSDPLTGYYSDRTQTRMGRRRPWMLASALPLAVILWMVWSPPGSLVGSSLVLWLGVSFVLLYTAVTVFGIPHSALGAEMSLDYRERTRIFAWRRGFFGLGAAAAMGGVALMTANDLTTPAGIAGARVDAFWIALVAGVLAAALIGYAALKLRERVEFQGRGARSPWIAVGDVLRNPHARVLLGVFLVQQFGVVSLTLTTSYYTDYILGRPQLTAPILIVFMLSGTLSIPLWMGASRRFEKKPLLVGAMAVIGSMIGAFFFLGPDQVPLVMVLAGVAGAATGGADMLFPSIQADVIDYDEYRTGERKEGTYMAVWNFSEKTAAGLVGITVGLVLQGVGYVPNVEQPEGVRLAIMLLFAGVPFFLYAVGIALFLRFDLGQARHAEIRAAIIARPSARPSG